MLFDSRVNSIIVFSILLLILSILAGCSNKAIDCCEECIDSYSQSPVAYGPTGAKCGHFMSALPMEEGCENYFEQHNYTVSQCERLRGREQNI